MGKAHTEDFTPSVGMFVWAYKGNTEDAQSVNTEVLTDKKVLIEGLSELYAKGKISLSEDITLIAEGCDSGDYLPLLFAALTRDGKQRVIRPFLINGSDAMVDKACRIAYTLLHTQGHNMIFGGVCNAFDCPPSELKRFPSSQKIFTPFRLGVVGGYTEIKRYLSMRVPIMGLSGLCCYSLLLDTKTTRETLEKEFKGQVVTRAGQGYTEFFRVVRPPLLDHFIKELPKAKKDDIIHSLRDNPIHQKCPTFPCFTVFQENALQQIVADVGGKLLETDTLTLPIHTRTDSGVEVDIRGLIIAKK